ncbi:hypothetical protein SAMN04489712_105183 [Thermomonospora echinospora]|uniref:SMI1 / KNR4 family (SUKH-1) n=1 Tax=Thermomonospora echinospora TaxID=1992 RepID=A0A1H6A383_9ACTN|nr:SMI1/KNR4 family protein [Thermomonospora echinospora]SEG43188.1 hypothetical protein SAMN04489712_105183 [Thermomonospora echinospora]
MNITEINGLPLPRELLDLLDSGRWRVPDDRARLAEVFGDRPVQPVFYQVDLMLSENAAWAGETSPYYLGEPDPIRPPGDIDPRRSLLIGDLGPDLPFALDYRGPGEPGVCYLASWGDRWVTVAESVADLAVRCGL